MSKRIEIKKGDRYGKLTIEEELQTHICPSGQKKRRFKCLCDCGSKPIVVSLNDLRSGRTQSCGCLQKQKVSEANSKTKTKINKYDLSGDVGVGYTSTGDVFYFDKEDFELIKDYSWCISNDGYVMTVERTTGKTVSLHRLVMHPREDEVVDHINRDTTNNCKSNLRVCSRADNTKNISVSKKNTSGITGVFWDKPTSKWRAQIQLNRKKIYLGLFTSKAEAIKTRVHSELEMFGEYAPTYFCFTEEQREAILNDTMSSEKIVEILQLNQDISQCI